MTGISGKVIPIAGAASGIGIGIGIGIGEISRISRAG
jgi:hypothetical protein